ncbi:MAG: hypothetical protein Fur0010_01810 [Bdellovibrio sp.]
MKKVLGFAVLLLVSTNSFAGRDFTLLPEEDAIIMEGKIQAAMMVQLESRLNSIEENYNLRMDRLSEPFSLTEGKIRAAMILMIEERLNELRSQIQKFDPSNDKNGKGYENLVDQLNDLESIVDSLV